MATPISQIGYVSNISEYAHWTFSIEIKHFKHFSTLLKGILKMKNRGLIQRIQCYLTFTVAGSPVYYF